MDFIPADSQKRSSAGQRGDLLRPSSKASLRAIIHSRRTWQSLQSSAQKSAHYPDACCNLRSMINNAPAIPEATHVPEKVYPQYLALQGAALYQIVSKKPCTLSSQFKQSLDWQFSIANPDPKLCRFSDHFPSAWPGFDALSNAQPTGNYLFAFVMGWSYVLSARLIELRRMTDEDTITYAQNVAPIYCRRENPSEAHHCVDIGNADEQEIRWWAAVLAKGPGWEANLTRSGKGFSPAWACHLDDSETVAVLYHNTIKTSLDMHSKPPTSVESQNYLVKFARLHDAFDQLIAAFAAILTLPGHYGNFVLLPRPQAMGVRRDTESKYADMVPSTAEIPHFMFISAIGYKLGIDGVFWEPGVRCTRLSEWMYPPIHEVLPTLIEQKDYPTLVQMMAARRPTTASVWLGAAITGTLPHALQLMHDTSPRARLQYTVWSGCQSSFMDNILFDIPKVYRNFRGKKVISRDHEIWLFYMTHAEPVRHGLPPFSGFSPFGYVKLRDTAPEVKAHVSCGHRLNYSHWIWQSPGRGFQSIYDDYGYPTSDKAPLKRPPKPGSVLRRLSEKVWIALLANFQRLPDGGVDESQSENATVGFYQWIFYQSGVKPGEMDMYRHDWLKILLEDLYENSSDPASSQSLPNEK